MPIDVNAYSDIQKKYAACMEQVKLRMSSILSILNEEKSTGYNYTDTEFVCLQFRKVLELIALANLVSNKDQYAIMYNNFANHYHAKHILKDIEKINPNFYPIPTRQIVDEKTKRVKETINIKQGFLTKDEFVIIHGNCSELMHAENPFAVPKELGILRSKFQNWYNQILILLNHHQLQLVDTNLQIWVIMNSDDSGRIAKYLFKKNGIVEDVKED